MLCQRAMIADKILLRMRGLLFRKPLERGEGLYIEPCKAIHMFGMTYAIDVVFLDRNLKVVGLVESIGPGKLSAYYGAARSCLELPAGTISDTATQLGDAILISDACA